MRGSPEGVRLLVPDLRGAGESDRRRTDTSSIATWRTSLAVLDAEGIQRAVLIGHSMGGQIAQLVAATRPARVAGLCGVLPVPVDRAPASCGGEQRCFARAGGNAEALGRILDMASPGLNRGGTCALLADALRIAPRLRGEAFDTWTAGGFVDRLARCARPR